jgi:antitoxin ParD1/3/4
MLRDLRSDENPFWMRPPSALFDKIGRAVETATMARDITTINISLPRKLRADMERKIKREAYDSASGYVRDLIRKDLQAQAIDELDELLLESLNSPTEPYDGKWLQRLKTDVIKPGFTPCRGAQARIQTSTRRL